tara:strand:- start:4922 stop:6052 length:1131 start_codon:yes stop_codon:yes gene_type:complete
MAKLLKLRRGTTTQHGSFTGAEGEVTIDTTKDTAVVHDGSQAGGRPLLREDLSNLPAGTIDNADINASAAIAGTKISPNFGTQDITTEGKILFSNLYPTEASLPNASTYHGMFAHVHGTGAAYFAHGGNWIKLAQVDGSDNLAVAGNITVTGTVDGRDVAADGTKLDGVESSATADQTAAEIRTLVESATDSNVFTDADHTKLNGIEASATADQTAAEIASALNGQDVLTTGIIGRDSTDYFSFTDNTQCDLYINGSNEFRFEADGDFHADGDVIAQSTTTASDRRLKENIEVIPNSLEKVQALNGVSFDWKKTGEKSAGVIAQEVQEVLPEAVKEVTPVGGGDSHLTVNYHALTSILIESIKELKAEIEELKGGK